MAEYIDRAAFLAKMEKTDRYFMVKFDIEDFPTADVAPVLHGRWIDVEKPISCCSVCGASNGLGETTYCPNCGARCDLEVLTMDDFRADLCPVAEFPDECRFDAREERI